MIIIPDTAFEHAKAVEAKAEFVEEPVFDPPPTYASSSSPPPDSPSQLEAPRSKPTNYLSLDRPNNTIKGTYTINPLIPIPQSFLPPHTGGETEADRKNLRLFAKNGSVDVNINLLSDSDKEEDRKRRTTLDVGSKNGSVKVKLCRIDIPTSANPVPFHLVVGSQNGSVTVGLPRTFEGLMTIYSKNGSVKISDGITQRIAMHNEENSTQRCFVGDISSYNEDKGDWAGDRLDVSSHNGRVKIYLVEEVALEAPAKKGGFTLLSRLLGI